MYLESINYYHTNLICTGRIMAVLEIGHGQRIFWPIWPIGQRSTAKISGQIAIGNWPWPNVFLADLANWPMAKMAKIGRSFIIIMIISFFYEFKLLTLFCYNKWHLIINLL